MNKFNKKFASIQLSKVKVYCQPEVFALGCFFEPSMRQQNKVTEYLKNNLGAKFSDYGIQNQMLWMCYEWFLPSIEYRNSRFDRITNRFWKSSNAGTIAHKLPTIRDKDFQNSIGISDRTSRNKLQTLISTKLVKSYVDEAKSINSNYTKIRYVQLNVPLILAILYSREDLFTAHSFLRSRSLDDLLFQDVVNIIYKSLEIHLKLYKATEKNSVQATEKNSVQATEKNSVLQ